MLNLGRRRKFVDDSHGKRGDADVIVGRESLFSHDGEALQHATTMRQRRGPGRQVQGRGERPISSTSLDLCVVRFEAKYQAAPFIHKTTTLTINIRYPQRGTSPCPCHGPHCS